MNPRLLHLYGPLYINSYGLFIALGIIVVMLLARNNSNYKDLITSDQFISLIMYCILGGVIGGRLLYLLTSWHALETPLQAFAFWNGGGSVLGSILGVLCIVPLFAKKNNLPLFALLDFVALYTPLLQSISRIGCFFAGCCFGKVSTSLFSVVYSNPDSVAPLYIPLHPTQLYSAIMLFFIFLLLYYAQDYFQKPGQIISLYLALACSERFFIDFIRGDQQFLHSLALSVVGNIFSINQWIALMIFFCATIAFFQITIKTQTHESL